MTPDENIEQQIAELNAGLENVMRAIATLTTTVERGHTKQDEHAGALLRATQEQDKLFLKIANQLDELGSALPRVGRELANAARELRDRVEPPKKKTRRAWSANR